MESSTDEDPLGQFNWLVDKLNEARQKNKSVLIVKHLVNGKAILKTNYNTIIKEIYNRRYLSIYRDYDDVILAVLMGHLHSNIFRLFKTKSALRSSYIAGIVQPGLTTLGNDPSFRIYRYSESDNKILLKDYDQIYLNLNESKEPFEWKLEYQFSKRFNLDQLNGASYVTIYDRLINAYRLKLNSTKVASLPEQIFDYYKEKNVFKHCNQNEMVVCEKMGICSIQSMLSDEFIDCVQNKNSFLI
jgi:hypothetical protein